MPESTAPSPTGLDPLANRARTHSLYRKYRPQSFAAEDLVGQEHIVRVLRNAIRLDRIAHAYLFCGPRGTGKTTTARLLAKAVNCLDPDPDQRPCGQCASCLAIASGATTDVIEIDAASNRGIDDIRDLRERVKYAPTQLHTKFYIVDEAHQITGAAANAFLKTLEEPPAHTKFVLATTDPEELLPTIVSRCQRFDFRRIGYDAAVGRLRTVATAEHLAVDDEALSLIARHSTGSLRDGLSLLDQLSLSIDSTSDQPRVSAEMVRDLLGISRNDRVESLVAAIADQDPAAALTTINTAVDAGEDPRQINRQLVTYLRLLLHQRAGGSIDADATAQALAARFELNRLAELARSFSEIDFAIKHASLSHLPLEVALVQAIVGAAAPAVASLNEQRPAPAPVVSDRPAPRNTPTPAASPTATGPAVSLRDRVRGAEAATPLPAPSRAVQEEPAAWPAAAPSFGVATVAFPPDLKPERVSPSATAPESPATPVGGESASGAISIEHLADLWPRVRQDVKSLNRRIEALLASADPVRVTGDTVILAAAYPFHRDKLNTDDVRGVLEPVVSRISGMPLTVTCILRNELRPEQPSVSRPADGLAAPDAAIMERTPVVMGSASDDATQGASAASPAGESPPATLAAADSRPDKMGAAPTPSTDLVDNHEQRLTAARNIFDAELMRGEGSAS